MPDIELSQALVWLLNSLKTIINHEVYARRAQIIQMMNQFISAKRNDQTVAEYYHDLVG
nr:hypothetical protein [Limosilactobacillus fermentum]